MSDYCPHFDERIEHTFIAQGFYPRSPYKPFAFPFKGRVKGYALVSVGMGISAILCSFGPKQLRILWFLVDRRVNISLATSMKLKYLLVVAFLAGSLLSQASEYGYLSFTGTISGPREFDDEIITLNAGDRIDFIARAGLYTCIRLTLPDLSSVDIDGESLVGNRSSGAKYPEVLVGPCELRMYASSSNIGSLAYIAYKITRNPNPQPAAAATEGN